jgi:hypothetical protein
MAATSSRATYEHPKTLLAMTMTSRKCLPSRSSASWAENTMQIYSLVGMCVYVGHGVVTVRYCTTNTVAIVPWRGYRREILRQFCVRNGVTPDETLRGMKDNAACATVQGVRSAKPRLRAEETTLGVAPEHKVLSITYIPHPSMSRVNECCKQCCNQSQRRQKSARQRLVPCEHEASRSARQVPPARS